MTRPLNLLELRKIGELGRDLAVAGFLDEACSLFQMVLERNPSDSGCYSTIAIVYQNMGRFKDALKHYDRAIELHPGNFVALAYRGELRLRRGDVMGMVDIASAVELDPQGQSEGGRRARHIFLSTIKAV